MVAKTEDSIRGEASNDNLGLQSDHVSPLTSKPVLSASISQAAAYVPAPVPNVHNVDKPKQEKAKASQNSNSFDTVLVDLLHKKKVKRKPNSEMAEAQFRMEKAVAPQAEERHKQHKHVAAPPPKLNLPPAAPAGS